MASKRIKIRVKRTKPNATQRWLAAGTLMAYSAVGAGKAALAQQPAAPSRAPDQSRTLAIVQFDIPAGPLSDVFRSFEEATHVRVTAAEAGILLLSSPGVSGPFTTEIALKQLLRATGVAYRFDGAEAVTLSLQARSETVEVTERITQLSSAKYTSPIKDIPQTITIIPKAVIEQQGATTLRDVLRNVPGLTMTAGEGGTPAGDNMTMRGFSARNDIFIDGVRDLSPQSRDPFNMEQVEVTKGPTSAVSGRGSAGGTLNLVSKAPSLMQYVGGSFALGNADTRRATVDVNTPVKFLGERTAFRRTCCGMTRGSPDAT